MGLSKRWSKRGVCLLLAVCMVLTFLLPGVATASTIGVTFDANGGSPAIQLLDARIGEPYGTLFTQIEPPRRMDEDLSWYSGYIVWMEFSGWFTAPDDTGEEVRPTDTVTADSPRTLYAHWAPGNIPCTASITFHANGATPTTQTIDIIVGDPYETAFTQLQAPTKDDPAGSWQLIGWFSSPTDLGTQVFAEETVTEHSPRTLYARWEAINTSSPVSLDFFGNGGTPEHQWVQDCEHADRTFSHVFDTLTTPYMDGYTFTGWFTAPIDGHQVLPTDAVSEGAFFAHWTPIEPSEPIPPTLFVAFYADIGTPYLQLQLIPTTAGTEFTTLLTQVQTPTRGPHWTFAGWQTAEGLTPDPDFPITADISFYAQWTPTNATPPTATITFRANGGNPPTQIADTQLGTPYGTLFELIIPPTKIDDDLTWHTGQTVFMELVGWFTAPDNSGTQIHSTDMVTADSPRTLYAHWQTSPLPDLELTFNARGGTPETQIVHLPQARDLTFADATADITTPTRHGYHFLGWANLFDPLGPIWSPILSPTEPLYNLQHTFYAQWSADTSMPRVTFSANGGTPATQTIITTTNEPYATLFAQLIPPTNPNMEFVGWFTTPDGHGVQIHPTDRVTTDRTLHARWRNTALPGVTVTFYGNGGTPHNQDIPYAQVSGATFAEAFALITTPTRTGHRFIGWAGVSPSGAISPILSPTDPVRPGIFHAQWAPDNLPTALQVTFHANGGTPVTQTVSATVGGTFGTLFAQLQQPIRVDETHSTPGVDQMMTFQGWFTTPIYGGTQLQADTPVTADSPQVFYARWISADAPITSSNRPIHFMGNGGTPAQQVTHAYLGGLYEVAMLRVAAPTRAGFTFTGWFTQATGGIRVLPSDRLRTHDYTARLYAQWAPVTTPDPPPPPPPEQPPHISFHDVAAGRWYYDYIQFVAQRDIMQGTGGGAFSPNTNLSRAMLTTILWRLEGAPTGTPPADFPDVATGRWYSDAIAWAFDTGVVLGKSPNTFAPAASITREQFATMLFRFAEGAGFDITVCPDFTWSHFTDQEAISDWASRAMRWAVYNKFITGTSTTTLHPQGNTSRAQAAAILMRYLQAVEQDT